ncbi:hypothetical protein HN512_05020 [Candidatus Peregrinibacteria bacterium]|jgi:DNA-binding transcriptional ArsR family regulator|nr:hypothetical protein [Candidatus Peregrinibacteria bacterium]MBT3599168.1 hypothetical protein [Candidatus Peregrinibacteria bacterium]MBT4366829.1 hypothetical protein [Candidatus Peregrinibacteria bacterium]MBT6730675.1 hypothetical protein [Candidatus Peregrinibacteria bacterium]MBT7009146.1 hypothetical protein [Candidatus Peregrinibacteria bacterium]
MKNALENYRDQLFGPVKGLHRWFDDQRQMLFDDKLFWGELAGIYGGEETSEVINDLTEMFNDQLGSVADFIYGRKISSFDEWDALMKKLGSEIRGSIEAILVEHSEHQDRRKGLELFLDQVASNLENGFVVDRAELFISEYVIKDSELYEFLLSEAKKNKHYDDDYREDFMCDVILEYIDAHRNHQQ